MHLENIYILSFDSSEGWIQCDEIKNFISCENIKKFTDIGTFSLTVPIERSTHLIQGNWVFFGGFLGVIKKTVQKDDITGSTFTASGKCAKCILGQRVVVPPSSDDDLKAFDEISGATETCIKHYVTSQLIAPEDPKRIIPRLCLAPDHGRGLVDDAYYARYEPVPNVISALSVRASLGYDVFKTEDGLLFDIIVPRVRTENQTEYEPVILDIGKGISTRENEIDHTNEVNALYCTRAGYDFEDESFTQTFFYGNEISEGLERHEYASEVSVDSNADDPYLEFDNAGKEELESYEPVETCEISIDPDLDVILGDWVTLVLKDGRKIDRQITEISNSWTVDGHTRLATLGEKYLTRFEKIERENKKKNALSIEGVYTKNKKTAEQLVKESVDQAAELMARAQGFYSFVKQGEAGWPNGRYISALPEDTTTINTEVWIQSISGYAHYPNGVANKPISGMLANDTIIARVVNAGIVNSDSIQTDAITAEKIAAGAITAEKIAAGAITTEKIAADAITAEKIKAGSITVDKLAAGALTANAILVNDAKGNVLLKAQNGQVCIGGWNVDENSLYSGSTFDTSNTFLCRTGSQAYFKVAGQTINGLVFRAGERFGVTTTGRLYASDVVMPSGTLWLPYTDAGLQAPQNGVHLSPDGMYIQMDDTDGGGTYINVDRILVSPRAAPDGQFVRGTGIFDGTIMLANGVYDNGSLASGTQFSTNEIQFINSEVNANAARIHYGIYNNGYSGMKLLSDTLILAAGSAINNNQDNKIVVGVDPTAGTGVRITGSKISANKSIAVDSDRNLKYDIESLEARYSKLLDLLRPVRFKYNDDKNGKFHTGFIAQEVQEAMLTVGIAADEFGGHSVSNKGTQSLAYEEFIALIVYELQLLKKQIQK